MEKFARHVSALLQRQGHVYFEEASPPRQVETRRDSGVILATLDFGQVRHRAAVKQLPTTAHVSSAGDLGRIHEQIRAQSPFLAASLPRILGYDEASRCIIMDMVARQTLETLLKRELRPWRRGREPGQRWLAEAARLLAAIHRLPAARVGVAIPPQSHADYRTTFEPAWQEPAVQRFVPARWRSPQRFYDSLPDSFFSRSADSLLAIDAQPKNMLIGDGDSIALIDLDYATGNPAMGVSFFLVSLDRLGMRHLLSFPFGRIAAWKQCFLAAYERDAPPDVLQDLRFFYPWVLLRMLEQHRQRRPWGRHFLTWYYGRCLGDYLVNVGIKACELGIRLSS